MRRLLVLLPLLAIAGCQTRPDVYSPVGNVRYTALGHDPFWMVTIGDDRIVLALGDEGGRADGAINSFSYPRTLPRTVGGVRTWESGDGGTAAIGIEARRGPCTGSGGTLYQDHVRVRLSGRELTGCGGRMIEEPRG